MNLIRRLNLALRAFWLCLWYGDRVCVQLDEDEFPPPLQADIPEGATWPEVVNATAKVYADRMDQESAQRRQMFADFVEFRKKHPKLLPPWIDTTRHGEP